MIIDTSALLAVILDEDDGKQYGAKIEAAPIRKISVASLLEATMVVESRGGITAGYDVDDYIARARIEIVPVTIEQIDAARIAWRRFGKGNHPAGLNFGDCFSYALAKTTGEPLLFKGNDFSQTDIQPA